MSAADRKEAEIRRLLDTPHPPVPTDLCTRATTHGIRLRRHRRALHRTACVLLLVAALAFAAWASATEPWRPPPSKTTPLIEGW
ncbi:hypothetical protein [Streptomyces sp. NPDC000410]|uniref:hypothetical protein n=1 Tax=Streptomyces sp. NPDC000410 TaxID=3154254 RepID=UPI003333455D